MVVELYKRNQVGQKHISRTAYFCSTWINSDSSRNQFTPSLQKKLYFLTCYSSQSNQQKVWGWKVVARERNEIFYE